MKKIITISLLIFTFFLTGCTKNRLSTINLEELNEKLINKDTFVLYFTGDDDTLEKTLNEVLDTHELEGFKINTKKISDDEKNALEKDISYSTPCIVFIINGQDPSKLSHVTSDNTTKKELERRLVDMKFISNGS